MKRAACIAVSLMAATACGPTSTDVSSSHGTRSTGGGAGGQTITGVYLRHDSTHPHAGKAAAGVRIGI